MAYRRKPQQKQQILSAPSSFARGSTKAQGEGDEDEVTKGWDWSDDDDSHHSVGNVDESTAPTLAAKAIRASSGARRDSSLSSAYAAHSSYTRKPLPNASLSNFSPAIQKDSAEPSYQYTSMKNLGEPKLGGFWSTLAKKAKAIIEDDISSPKSATMSPGAAGGEAKSLPKVGSQGEHNKQFQPPENHQRSDGAGLHKGLGAIASSLTHIGGTIGNALEEGLSIVENRAVDIIQETRKFQVRRKSGNELVKNDYHNSKKPEMQPTTYPQTESDMEIQLKASRDVAMAMAAKTKVLLRELKTVKADFAFAKERCAQLEEENRVLRESLEKGDNPEDDDLVRLQLETLLAEKARLAHENSVYARENRFLREIVEYHQLTMQDVIYLDESNEEVSQVYPVGANMRSLSSPKTDDI